MRVVFVLLTFMLASVILLLLANKGGIELAKSSAEYYRKRRETTGQFSVPIPREKLDALTAKLKEQGKTKTKWLNEMIDKELEQ